MTDLPQPLTPADCDLRDFAFMPLDVVRLRDSDLTVKIGGDAFRCAVLLWCASWHQVPAASLPDDDIVLAGFAGFGRVVKEWKKIRTDSLRGWVKCSDGRLYHPVVAEKAAEAWIAKLKQRLRTECGRIKKHNERHGTKVIPPEFDEWMAAGCPVGQPLPVPSDKPHVSQGQGGDVASETHSKGQGYRQGQGQGQGQLTSKPDLDDSTVPDPAPPPDRDDPSETMPTARNVKIALLLRAQGVQATAQNPIVCVTWAQDQRVTDDVLNVAIAKARAAKPAPEQIPVKYLARIVEQELADQATPPPKAKPKGEDWSWKLTDQGMNDEGAKYGLRARGGERREEFVARILAEKAKRKGQP